MDISKLLSGKSPHGSSLLMESDGLSTPASPIVGDEDQAGSPDDVIQAKQQAALKTYIDSVPYECESPEHMVHLLQDIVGKISIAARSNRVEISRKLDEAVNTCETYFSSFRPLELTRFAGGSR